MIKCKRFLCCCCCLVAKSVCLFVTPWTIAHLANLSLEFSRQVSWSGLPFPSPGALPDTGIQSMSPSLALAGSFLFCFVFPCSLLLHLICEALGTAQTPHRAQGESTGYHRVLQPSPTPTSPLPQVLRHEQALSLPPQLENRFGPAQMPPPVWLPGHSQTS